jgi:mono/diheme cytochrome c family protein
MDMSRTLSLILMMLLMGACDKSPSYPERKPPEGFLQAQDNQITGRELFREHCVSCHGTLEEGRSPRTEFHPSASSFKTDRYRSIDPAYLYWRISKGKTVEPYLSRGSFMPAYGMHLSEEQIWQLVAYIRSRSSS